MSTVYCAKFKSGEGNTIKVDFLESKIERVTLVDHDDENSNLTIEENEKNVYRQNKLKWMFNTATFGLTSALIEVEIDKKPDFEMHTLKKAVTQFLHSMGLKTIGVRFVSNSSIDLERLITIINEFSNCISSELQNQISISCDVQLKLPRGVCFTDLIFKNVKKSCISIDISDFPTGKGFDSFISNNVLNVYYDVSQIPFYSDDVRNILLRLLKCNFKNTHIISTNKKNIPTEIYKEAIKMFYEDNKIQTIEANQMHVNLFESVCHSALPNEFIIDISGNIRKCKHNNNTHTIIGTIVNGNFDINFPEYLKWIIPSDSLLYKNDCFHCFYFPCCQGVACKYHELTNDDLLCPQKYHQLKEHLIKE